MLSVWKDDKFTKQHKTQKSPIFVKPFPEWHISDFSKLNDFADDNFKFDKNGEKFSYRLETSVGKEEIALYEQFLLFPQYSQKTCTADT